MNEDDQIQNSGNKHTNNNKLNISHEIQMLFASYDNN